MSDHFNGRKYFNPAEPVQKNYWQLLRWLATRRRQRWPRWIDDAAFPPPAARLDADTLALTFVNHSTFLLRLGGVNVLTDPVWSKRVSPVRWLGPRRVRRPGLALEQLPPIHVVLVSHNHYDHMDVPTLRWLERRFHPVFLTSRGNRRYLLRRGLGRVEELDWWHSVQAQGLTVTLTPAKHFSARGVFDRNRTLWGGFVLGDGVRKVYFAGDSGYDDHFKEIGRRLGPFTAALLPIGAYEPRWFMRAVHVDPDEAVQAHLDLGSPLSVAMHFGTFQLTDEDIDAPVRQLRRCLQRCGVAEERFRVLGFGETLLVSNEEKKLNHE